MLCPRQDVLKHPISLHAHLSTVIFPALGGSADVESIQAMMADEDQKEKGFLELLGKKMKDEGVGELEHDKTNKITFAPSEDRPVWSAFAICFIGS